ncbi:replication initiator [Streptomyces sp. NPDC059787]|uniref:replication initiator n=1 Tax=Streptomyces sp. NPDC059787 TaxID=3346947 RepID=UPI00364C82D9
MPSIPGPWRCGGSAKLGSHAPGCCLRSHCHFGWDNRRYHPPVRHRDEPGEHLLVRCCNHRTAVCALCSRLHVGDTFHLVRVGPDRWQECPRHSPQPSSLFVTLTAPSCGSVYRSGEHRCPLAARAARARLQAVDRSAIGVCRRLTSSAGLIHSRFTHHARLSFARTDRKWDRDRG